LKRNFSKIGVCRLDRAKGENFLSRLENLNGFSPHLKGGAAQAE